MSSDFSNAIPRGYFFSGEWPNDPQPIDPPDNTGGGLPGDPVRPDYVHPPTSIDPSEPEPEPPPPSTG